MPGAERYFGALENIGLAVNRSKTIISTSGGVFVGQYFRVATWSHRKRDGKVTRAEARALGLPHRTSMIAADVRFLERTPRVVLSSLLLAKRPTGQHGDGESDGVPTIAVLGPAVRDSLEHASHLQRERALKVVRWFWSATIKRMIATEIPVHTDRRFGGWGMPGSGMGPEPTPAWRQAVANYISLPPSQRPDWGGPLTRTNRSEFDDEVNRTALNVMEQVRTVGHRVEVEEWRTRIDWDEPATVIVPYQGADFKRGKYAMSATSQDGDDEHVVLERDRTPGTKLSLRGHETNWVNEKLLSELSVTKVVQGWKELDEAERLSRRCGDKDGSWNDTPAEYWRSYIPRQGKVRLHVRTPKQKFVPKRDSPTELHSEYDLYPDDITFRVVGLSQKVVERELKTFLAAQLRQAVSGPSTVPQKSRTTTSDRIRRVRSIMRQQRDRRVGVKPLPVKGLNRRAGNLDDRLLDVGDLRRVVEDLGVNTNSFIRRCLEDPYSDDPVKLIKDGNDWIDAEGGLEGKSDVRDVHVDEPQVYDVERYQSIMAFF
jgi:hypothetical protein